MTESIAFEVHLQATYEETLDRVAAALKVEGFGILTRVDVKATFQEKLGVEFRPYAILGVCNPPLAHRTLSRDARTGLMLPCNVTVEAEPAGGSVVRIVDPEAMLAGVGMDSDPVLAEVATEAGARLQRVAQALDLE